MIPQPDDQTIRRAIEQSLLSPCRSKRGAVIFGERVVSWGYNHKTRFACDGSLECKATCRIEAIHAEQMALLMAGQKAAGCDLLHVKTVDGDLVASGGPSCVECSKLALAVGIKGVWLYHVEGWKRYPIDEFHELSLAALRASSVVKEGHQTAICRECGCTTGGGSYCYAHKPYRVEPLKDGSFRVHRHGMKHVWFDEPPTVATEQPVVKEGQPMKENVLRAQPPESASTPDQAATTTVAPSVALVRWMRRKASIIRHGVASQRALQRFALQYDDEDFGSFAQALEDGAKALECADEEIAALLQQQAGTEQGLSTDAASPSVADTAPKIPLPPVQDGDPT